MDKDGKEVWRATDDDPPDKPIDRRAGIHQFQILDAAGKPVKNSLR